MVLLDCLANCTQTIVTEKTSTGDAFNPTITWRRGKQVLLISATSQRLGEVFLVKKIELFLLPSEDGTPATMPSPLPVRSLPFTPLSLPRHPITQQPVLSRIRRTSGLECGSRLAKRLFEKKKNKVAKAKAD
jgi:hypothetical protein